MSLNSVPYEKTLRILQQVELFEHVPTNVIEELCKKMLISSFRAEDRIINQGDEGNSMYVILSGKVHIHDGDFVVASLHEGSFFGEFSLLDDEPRSLSVSAATPCVTGTILQNDFYRIINKYPDVTKDIIKVMLKRLRGQNTTIIAQPRSRQRELENMVRERTADIQKKNEDLEKAIAELKVTQEQLIQQEKLASLGQLTAGIAHEIKNPLNFVNNFSVLTNDLIKELHECEDPEEREAIFSDIQQNLEKIRFHGHRADSIVSSMLDHARSSSRSRELIHLDQLCDEYLNLAFHGMRANVPDFNCTLEKNYEPNIPETTCIPQDIARVFLNLFNNAFYAVKGRHLPKVSVHVRTLFMPGKKEIEIRIRDNGSGIPEDKLNKIFQPFFTTKPAGQGTGLGLSISHDIMTAHGGSIRVESKENEYTEFVLNLPVTN